MDEEHEYTKIHGSSRVQQNLRTVHVERTLTKRGTRLSRIWCHGYLKEAAPVHRIRQSRIVRTNRSPPVVVDRPEAALQNTSRQDRRIDEVSLLSKQSERRCVRGEIRRPKNHRGRALQILQNSRGQSDFFPLTFDRLLTEVRVIQSVVADSMTFLCDFTQKIWIFLGDGCQKEEIATNANVVENLEQSRKAFFDSPRS